jgi:hypothetical protein
MRIGLRPTEEEELLLRASLLEGDEALEAWEEWASRVDIDVLDEGSRKLLPLLYRNLSTLGVESPMMATLKGIYRWTWYRNQMLFQTVSKLIQSFHASGIQTMIVNGAALASLHYNDYGLRHVDDADVLVPTDKALPAIELLASQGWLPTRWDLTKLQEPLLSTTHSEVFTDQAGQRLDLHWHLMAECCYENGDDDFWEASIGVDFNDVATSALNQTDELLLVCVHGAVWGPVRTHRWVADSMMILRTAESGIDWNRLIGQAHKRRLILQIRNALVYLRDLLDAPIPSEVVETLQSMGVSRIERIEYASATSPEGLTGGLPMTWFRYLRSRQLGGSAALRAEFLGFPRFLKHAWGLDYLWQVPFCAFSKALNKFRTQKG